MFNSPAHLGHDHNSEAISGTSAISDISHCMPIIIGLGCIILILGIVIGYLLTTRQPKHKSKVIEKNKK